MFSFLWDVHQESRIAAAQASAAGTAAKIGDVSAAVRELAARLDRLTLICHAMWLLLQEQTGLSDEALIERIKEVDLTDGRLDGKVARPPATCPKCGRTLSPRHWKCIWCGAEKPDASGFDGV